MCVESVCYRAPDSALVFLSREVRRGEGSTYVCRSRGCGLLSQVVVMNTILSPQQDFRITFKCFNYYILGLTHR